MKKLVIQSYERTRYDYVLDLSEQYVNDTNKWLQDYHKQVNGEDVPFLDLREPKGFMEKVKNFFSNLKGKV